ASDRAFCDLSLKIIEQRTALLRCHRQYLINLDQVDEIQLQGQGLARIRTRSGQLVPVSRRYLRQLRSHISQL
ncbi:MAG: LytTR family transcriptional regulator DNA-binding domain-containing protein, partial [Desulfuromonas sp.]